MFLLCHIKTPSTKHYQTFSLISANPNLGTSSCLSYQTFPFSPSLLLLLLLLPFSVSSTIEGHLSLPSPLKEQSLCGFRSGLKTITYRLSKHPSFCSRHRGHEASRPSSWKHRRQVHRSIIVKSGHFFSIDKKVLGLGGLNVDFGLRSDDLWI